MVCLRVVVVGHAHVLKLIVAKHLPDFSTGDDGHGGSCNAAVTSRASDVQTKVKCHLHFCLLHAQAFIAALKSSRNLQGSA